LDAKATIAADAFFQVAKNGNEQTCRAFIAANGDVNAQSSDGRFPLPTASKRNHISVCKRLLHARAKPDLAFNNWLSSLMYAASRGHCEVMHLLLQEGANVCLRSKKFRLGSTALHLQP
jgi:ankyrin repeat protein